MKLHKYVKIMNLKNSRKITVNAPAKINLYLNILGKQSDGYHTVEMIMQTVDLFDTITVTKNNQEKIKIASNYLFPESEEKNTAYQAAEIFFKHTNITNSGINIHINKKIPIGAGLAGGSADAAAVLTALNTLFNCKINKYELAQIGEKIGADVPFCLLGGTMLSTGIGTILSKIKPIPNCYILIIKPKVFISTRTAYANSDKFSINKDKTVSNILSAIENDDLKGISKCLYNRFEAVTALSEVDRIKHILRKKGALGACMSGTGSAVYGIFDDEKLAKYCKNSLSTQYKEIFLTHPIKHGCQ